MANAIGKIFRLTSFGESHGEAVGGVIEGCPSDVVLSVEEVQKELDRRRPGQSVLSTGRQEQDKVEILSGVFEGRTTGMPIGFIVWNCDHRSQDYEHLKEVYRPSHADFTWEKKYGVRDYRGGGRASAREHVARVVAGAVAKQVLAMSGISISAFAEQVGTVALECPWQDVDLSKKELNDVRCPDDRKAAEMAALIGKVREEGDSVGGVVGCVMNGVPVGLGEPVFDRFQARLAHAMMSINAAKGFEYGEGFRAAVMRGSEHNDAWIMKAGKLRTETNHSGGIQGGVTNGEDICFRVAFKPVSTIAMKQRTIDHNGNEVELEAYGRHDPCVVPRAVPVVEAMAAIVTLDLLLEAQAGKLPDLHTSDR